MPFWSKLSSMPCYLKLDYLPALWSGFYAAMLSILPL